MASPVLSVIVPSLNEAEHLPSLLSDLRTQRNITLEIIVGDGGSTDESEEIVRGFGGVFVRAPRGRGAQMNAAARRAAGEFLLFLHADSRIRDPLLLANALTALRARIDQTGRSHVAGHFSLRFNRSSQDHPMAYRYMEEKTAFNRTNTTNGDQSFLMAEDSFRTLGGFDESLPFLEDQRMAEQIRQHGTWITLPGVLYTSARRFEAEGFHRRYILMAIIMGLYSTGVDAFFRRAPAVYRSQQEAGRLMLTPFFRVIRKMMREDLGLKGSLLAWFRVGRYVRQNSWQMFYFFDIWARPLLGPGRYPFLTFHDRIFGPLTDFKLFDAVTAVLCFIWVMGILAPYFLVREKVP